MKKT
jgi:hypothetical protein